VSSFGYNGSIVHAVLRNRRRSEDRMLQLTPVSYKRRAFMWRGTTHPFVQICASSSESTVVGFRSRATNFVSLIANHIVQGSLVFPGVGYLEMARAAASTVATLHGVFFLQPLTVEALGLLVECLVTQGYFEVRSGQGNASADASVYCQGALAASEGWQRFEHAAVRVCSCARAANVGSLYDGFDAAGLQYGPGYRKLSRAWYNKSAAVAMLRMRPMREGIAVHPADLDDALCASAAFAMSGGCQTMLPFSVKNALLQGAPGEIWAVCCLCSFRLETPS
jgi:hypothetical protein